MKKLALLTLSLFLIAGTAFADSPKDSPKDATKDATKDAAAPAKTAQPAKPAAAKSSAEIAAEVEELRQTLQAQQEQLQLLKEELAKRDKQIEEARETAASANARASEATVKASEAVTTSAEVKSTTSELNSTVSNLAASNAAVLKTSIAANPQAQPANEDKGPTTIRFKGVNITPGGFIEAATVNRTHAESADINTQFNGIPYGGSSLSKLSEFNFTARQSRLTLLFGAKVGSANLSGYFEADFLGAGVTSNNRQTNSYVFRQRQIWGQAALENGWTFTGGQMWSLATENRKGISVRSEYLPMMIDPQYVVGFTWQRAYAFRVTKSFSDQVSAALSMEGPQITIGGRGFSTYTNTSALGATTTFQNFFIDAPGNLAGLYNAFDPTGYSINQLPDFIAKVAFDPGFGHYEVFGIISEFRDRIFPCAVVGTTAKNFPTPATPTVFACNGSTTPSATFAYNNSSTGGGVGASATVSLLSKKLDLGLKAVGGDGTGRFGSAQLADVTARPNGTLALIHNFQYLGRVEVHPSPKWDFYGYFGGEYDARVAYTGYSQVKITNTPAIPGCGAVGQQPCSVAGTIQPSYPALTTTTVSNSVNNVGGYGSPYANNTGCTVEVPPAGSGAPGTGGTCAGDTRYLFEATFGFWNKIYQGEKGRLQWGLQYSYFSRYDLP
jgi:sugar-specific transcriptional regulator TrmB